MLPDRLRTIREREGPRRIGASFAGSPATIGFDKSGYPSAGGAGGDGVGGTDVVPTSVESWTVSSSLGMTASEK